MSQVPLSHSQDSDYAWELATLYPEQGEWSENEYLDLTDETNGRVEFTDGRLEFLQMPTEIHEALVQFLFFSLHGFVKRKNRFLTRICGSPSGFWACTTGVFEAFQGKKKGSGIWPPKNDPDGTSRQGQAGLSSRPDLAIPRRVARQQSPTPFHQAKTSLLDD